MLTTGLSFLARNTRRVGSLAETVTDQAHEVSSCLNRPLPENSRERVFGVEVAFAEFFFH